MFSSVKPIPAAAQPDGHLVGRNAVEAGLVLISCVGALLHLDHLDFFKHLESMTAGGQKNHVTPLENAAPDVIAVVVVKIHAQAPALDEQHFLCELNAAIHRIVNVRLDHLPRRMAHVRQLLG